MGSSKKGGKAACLESPPGDSNIHSQVCAAASRPLPHCRPWILLANVLMHALVGLK